ncbi:MAG TPA: hypothetical protein VMV19_05695 [Xanthobacteraceae bacterium]|nr:hypothetical protein [Xanthobacteraceae bacterium]
MQAKLRSFRQKIGLITVAMIAAIVSGCVESHTPILTKTEPVFGSQFEVHLYNTFVAGRAQNVEVLVYRWHDHGYKRAEQRSEDAAELVVEPLDETSFIVQTHNDDAPFHYSIAQKIFDGVFLVRPIEESDAAPETQAKICGNDVSGIICMIRNSDQLVELAHATAGKPPHNPLLAVIVRSGE